MTIPSVMLNPRAGGQRFILPSAGEFTRLFGSPDPLLPAGEPTPSGEVIQVVLPPELDTAAGRHLEHLRVSILEADGSRLPPRGHETELDYSSRLTELLQHAARYDRRLGLMNLFWLAHGKSLRDRLVALLPPGGGAGRSRYRLMPPLTGLLARAQRQAFGGLPAADKRAVALNFGAACNWGIVDSLLEDQFALTELDVRRFDARESLGALNPRFQMEGDAFAAILEALNRRFSADLESRDGETLRILRRRTCGYLSREDASGRERDDRPSFFSGPVLDWYLADDEIRRELEDDLAVQHQLRGIGGWRMLSEEFQRIARALQRSEYLQMAQEAVTIIPGGLDDAQIKGLFLEGKLFKFSVNFPVVNDHKTVSILFADIREFTRTSETAISERELTERLYDTFDPLVHVVSTIGGTIDKFTGDGMMVTFGAARTVSDNPLRALRCAIAMQEAVERLRGSGRTSFQMGLSLHSGRVFVGEFIHDERSKETTVIGRQVNLAGRMSSTRSLDIGGEDAGDDAGDDAPEAGVRRGESLRTTRPSDVGAVFLDPDGNFYNVGVAASVQFVEALRGCAPLDPVAEGDRRGYRFVDRYLKSEVLFLYAGDAKFKGFRDSVPVYGISWRRVATAPAAAGRGGEV